MKSVNEKEAHKQFQNQSSISLFDFLPMGDETAWKPVWRAAFVENWACGSHALIRRFSKDNQTTFHS